MRRVLMVLALVLCFCGCAYAYENPYEKALERTIPGIDEQQASRTAKALSEFYETGEVFWNLINLNNGLGEIIVFDKEKGGVYVISDVESYNNVLIDRAHKEPLNRRGIVVILVLGTIYAILELTTSRIKSNSRRKKILKQTSGLCLLACMAFGFLSIFNVISLKLGNYDSPAVVKKVLREDLNGKVRFYKREEARGLLEEFAGKYRKATGREI